MDLHFTSHVILELVPSHMKWVLEHILKVNFKYFNPMAYDAITKIVNPPLQRCAQHTTLYEKGISQMFVNNCTLEKTRCVPFHMASKCS
jgi:hypothetical protein